MALIAMAVWDTEENGRSKFTKDTLNSLGQTISVYDGKHRIVVVDNGSCQETKALLSIVSYSNWCQVITLPENIGTAKAINKAWQLRKPGENCVKMDNDVVIHQPVFGEDDNPIDQDSWIDILEECIKREPTIGIIGLKRKDCIETPWNTMEWYRSELVMLPHEPGQRWLIVEKVHHVMGTCQMYSSACLDKLGYLYQMGELYGFDDALASVRANVAGFITVHYPHIVIDHIDPGGDAYYEWKKQSSGLAMKRFNVEAQAYRLGYKPVYCGPEGE